MNELINTEKSKLSAVLITDNFNRKLSPLTDEFSISLFPLCNHTIIEYNIEYLLSYNIDEIIIPLTSHKHQQTRFIQSKYPNNNKLRLIHCPNSTCIGDILRHIESIQLIKSTFILMNCTTITNINLTRAIQQHHAYIKQDKFLLATIILSSTTHSAHTDGQRHLADDTIVWMSDNQQILQLTNELESQSSSIDSELLHEMMSKYSAVDIRYDLIDHCMDICTVDVLAEYRDNFDYNDMRNDFVHGVLSNSALGNTIYAYIDNHSYCCDISDIYQYHNVSQHILQRYISEYAPDMNRLNNYNDINYVYNNGIYEPSNNTLSLARDVMVDNTCMFGNNVSIQSNTLINNSIIGHNVQIGSNCEIINSHIWSDVTIADNVKIMNSLIANNCTIQSDAVINPGCIISYNVTIGTQYNMKSYTRATTIPKESDTFSDDEQSDDDNNSTKPASQFTDLGPGSNGRVYDIVDDSNDNESIQLTKYNLNSMLPDKIGFMKQLRSIETESIDEVDLLDGNDDTDDNISIDTDTTTIPTTTINDNTIGTSNAIPVDQLRQSINEVIDTIKRGSVERLDIDGIVLEMSSLKLSRDMSTQEYAHATFRGIYNLIDNDHTIDVIQPTQSIIQQLGHTLKYWSPVLTKYSRLQSDQLIFVYGLEDSCSDLNNRYHKLFTPTLQLLYDVCDIIEEDTLLQWDQIRRQHKHIPQYQLWLQSQEFLEWLKSASEDDSDDDDD